MKRAWRVVFTWLLLVVYIGIACLPVAATPAQNAASEARNGVVRILGIGADGSAWTGSGFAVGEAGKSSSVFITNHHVSAGNNFAGAEELYILLDDEWYIENDNGGIEIDKEHVVRCHVVYEPETYPDFAVLQAERIVTERVALPLMSAELAEPGETVYALGYPGASDQVTGGLPAAVDAMTVTKGTVSRRVHMAEVDTEVIQIDAQINHGNSGGPLITEEGYVIGLNTYGFQENIYAAVEIDYVIDRLNHLVDIGTLHNFTFTTVTTREEESSLWPIIGACVAGGAVIVGAVTVLLVRRVKKKAPVPAPVVPDTFPQTVPAVSTIGQTMPAYALEPLRLVGVEGTFAGRRFALEQPVRLGRDPEKNDLVFAADTAGVSGVHCVLTPVSDGVMLTDLGSTYGTFLADGTRLTANQAVTLQAGDRFSLGGQTQVFVIEHKNA